MSQSWGQMSREGEFVLPLHKCLFFHRALCPLWLPRAGQGLDTSPAETGPICQVTGLTPGKWYSPAGTGLSTPGLLSHTSRGPPLSSTSFLDQRPEFKASQLFQEPPPAGPALTRSDFPPGALWAHGAWNEPHNLSKLAPRPS